MTAPIIKDYRDRWKEENPDKFVKVEEFIGNAGYACHKARCTWSPNCGVQELVNYCDNGTGNYGGRVENVRQNEDGTETGTVVIYFD